MLLGDLSLDANPALHALQGMSSKIEHFEHDLKNLGKSLGGFAVVVEAVEKVAEGFEGILAMGAHMEALHLATGESVHDLVIFGQALEITGGHAETAQNFIFKLQNAIAGVNEDGTKTAGALKTLGTSAAELRELPLLDQVHKLSEGVQKIGDQATKVATIKELFGFRFAAQALPLLANPHALEEAAKQAGPLADLLDRNAEKFHELEAAMKGLTLKKGEIFGGALEVLAPEATDLAEAINGIDFTGIGHGLGALLDIFLQLGKILAALAPLINGVSKALDGMASPRQILADLGLIEGSKHEDKKHGLADQFKGLAAPDQTAGKKDQVSALQRVGLGGGFGGGPGDPQLAESQRQSRLLEQVVRNTAHPQSHTAAEPPPV